MNKQIAIRADSQLFDRNPKMTWAIFKYNSRDKYYLKKYFIIKYKIYITLGIFSDAFAISSSFSWTSSISLNFYFHKVKYNFLTIIIEIITSAKVIKKYIREEKNPIFYIE